MNVKVVHISYESTREDWKHLKRKTKKGVFYSLQTVNKLEEKLFLSHFNMLRIRFAA